VILCIYAAQKLMLGCYLPQQVWRNRSPLTLTHDSPWTLLT
jgi:hypothetical protein